MAVTVTDVDEAGEVVISWLQPEVGVAITASLTDPDGPGPVDNAANVPDTTAITTAEWVWTVSEIVQGSLDVANDDHWGLRLESDLIQLPIPRMHRMHRRPSTCGLRRLTRTAMATPRRRG